MLMAAITGDHVALTYGMQSTRYMWCMVQGAKILNFESKPECVSGIWQQEAHNATRYTSIYDRMQT